MAGGYYPQFAEQAQSGAYLGALQNVTNKSLQLIL